MKGFPKTLNSKSDYMYIRENYPKEIWAPYFQALLDERYCWYPEKELESSNEGLTDNTHKVVENNNTENDVVSYTQYILKRNPMAKITRLGFTVKEVQKMLRED